MPNGTNTKGKEKLPESYDLQNGAPCFLNSLSKRGLAYLDPDLVPDLANGLSDGV